MKEIDTAGKSLYTLKLMAVFGGMPPSHLKEIDTAGESLFGGIFLHHSTVTDIYDSSLEIYMVLLEICRSIEIPAKILLADIFILFRCLY